MIKILFILIISFSAFSQNLFKERIRKVPDRKKAIYLDSGIFHHLSNEKNATLNTIRNSYVASRKYERIVFDFSTNNVPRIYGFIDQKNNKLNMDLFGVTLSSKIKTLKNTKYIKNIDFYNIDAKALSIEIILKEKVSYDIFVLNNPARLVIDIQK